MLREKDVLPKLVILRCGENEADGAYIRGAMKRGGLCGVDVELRTLAENVSADELARALEAVNSDNGIHGCLLLRPLPGHLKAMESKLCALLDPKKDVDGMTPVSAAGVFTGILSGTGMVDAMSKSLLAVIPPALGPYLATITALVSMPFTFFMSNDAFYYGVLPILTQAAAEYGITPVEMARASIVGQPVHLLSPLVPSTYLLVGLAKIDFGDHQRFTLKWAVLVCLAILAMALLLGLFPLFSN